MLDTTDRVNERFRWAAGILSLISTEPDAQACVTEGADCAAVRARDARRLLGGPAEREPGRNAARRLRTSSASASDLAIGSGQPRTDAICFARRLSQADSEAE